MAECHPVGFRWVMEAKARGATIIHVDPRFTRTSAVADLHVPIRAGIGHRVPRRHHPLHPRERALLPRVRRQLHQRRRDHRARTSRTPRTWTACSAAGTRRRASTTSRPGSTRASSTVAGRGRTRSLAAGDGAAEPARQRDQPTRTATRRCSTRAACSRSSSATSRATRRRWSSRSAACRRSSSCKVAEALCDNSGPRAHRRLLLRGGLDAAHGRRAVHPHAPPSSSCCSATSAGPAAASWRCAATPPSRAPPTSRRSTTCCPATCRCRTPSTDTTLDDYLENNAADAGLVERVPEVHRLAAQGVVRRRAPRRRTTGASTTCPRLTGDHSHMTTVADMADGKREGLLRHGREPGRGLDERRAAARGAAQARLAGGARLRADRDRRVLARRARDAARRGAPEDIGTEVFFFPAAAHTEKDGTFTNTQRLLQWHHKAVEPPGDCRSELHFVYHLGPRLKELLRGLDGAEATGRIQRPDLGLPDATARTRSPTPRRCWRRSTATPSRTASRSTASRS